MDDYTCDGQHCLPDKGGSGSFKAPCGAHALYHCREFLYRGFADENQNFVDKIAANPDLCATAQASVADFVGMFQAIVHQGGEVLCVVISSRLSGAYSSACIAAKAVDAEKVRVVDSRTTAGGLALLLKKAAKLIRQGYPLEDIVAQVKKQREKTASPSP